MLTLLLACTDSKRFPPAPGLRMEANVAKPLLETRKAWKAALRGSEPVSRAGKLYKGGYWTAATRARIDAAVPIKTLVVSAGLGLVDVQDWVPSYAATFTPGTPDSIPGAGNSGASRLWWSGLGAADRFKREVTGQPDPRVIAALPTRYLDAAQPALADFVRVHGHERLAVLGGVGGKSQFPEFEQSWVALDLRMVHKLGGTAGQLTARALRWVCDQLDSPASANPDNLRRLLAPLVDPDAPPLYPKRKKRTPEEVEAWILRAWSQKTPPTSATAALRRFRAEGNAFEQKRFSSIYRALDAQRED
ncbi:MAG: hypothetical protein VX899_07980 [Myxococcota bacterium]|nr:hypothetical protein [Myxococcota bacterium]